MRTILAVAGAGKRFIDANRMWIRAGRRLEARHQTAIGAGTAMGACCAAIRLRAWQPVHRRRNALRQDRRPARRDDPGLPRHRSADRSAQQLSQPGPTFAQPVTAFRAASARSISGFRASCAASLSHECEARSSRRTTPQRWRSARIRSCRSARASAFGMVFELPTRGGIMSGLCWLTDERMGPLRPLFPTSRGRPRGDDRRVLGGIASTPRNGVDMSAAALCLGVTSRVNLLSAS